jgi:hypothetical protein
VRVCVVYTHNTVTVCTTVYTVHTLTHIPVYLLLWKRDERVLPTITIKSAFLKTLSLPGRLTGSKARHCSMSYSLNGKLSGNVKGNVKEQSNPEPRNVLSLLKARELKLDGQNNVLCNISVSNRLEKRIDEQYNNCIKVIKSLNKAVDAKNWDDIEHQIGKVIACLLDEDPRSLFEVTDSKKQRREFFVVYGGLDSLLRTLRFAFKDQDPQNIKSTAITTITETLNEILVVLRELVFSISMRSDKGFDDSQLAFFFSLLSHKKLFDNTMNFVEEVLASREEPFNLSLVTNLFDLLSAFDARQLAHFCRVLSLLLFEPEDRQIMEGSHSITSSELLQLRRNRLFKNSNQIVERNQCLVRLMHTYRAMFVKYINCTYFRFSIWWLSCR